MGGAGELRVGTSGWHYNHWAGRLYPEKLPKRRWLEHFQRSFDTVELNVTFYRLPPESTFELWARTAPKGFRFAAKGPRLVTHMKKLRNTEENVELFLSRARLLRPHLGPVLWQLPPQLRLDVPRLADFLAALPRRGLTHAFEFRNPEWWTEDVYRTLEKAKATFVVWHRGRQETPVVTTGRSVYLRFHGVQGNYGGLYGRERLEPWARRARAWLAEGRDVWAYFNNDVGGAAVEDALAFRELATR